jgi:putative hydrolase of the HAD superfamily
VDERELPDRPVDRPFPEELEPPVRERDFERGPWRVVTMGTNLPVGTWPTGDGPRASRPSPRGRWVHPRTPAARGAGRAAVAPSKPMPPARAVVFDWYNTLAAPNPDDFWTRLPELIADAGGTPDEDALHAWDRAHPLAHGEHSSSESTYRRWQRRRFEQLLERCEVDQPRRSALLDHVEQVRYSRLFEVFDDAVEVVEELRARGLSVGICSNWDWDLERHLRHNGLDALVDFVVCSAVEGYRKPHPAIFDTVRRHAGDRSGSAIVFVGDSWSDDITGATRAGLRAVHVSRSGAPCEQGGHGAIPCVADLRSVVPLV